VRGNGLQILNMMFVTRTASCTVDLSRLTGTTDGVYTVERDVFIRGMNTPEPVSIKEVFPASVMMATGDLYVKAVPVTLRTNFATREGFEVVGMPMPEPVIVEARGTKSVVEGITTWPTLKLSLADLHSPTTEVVGMSDSLTTLLNIVPPVVRVHVDVQQKADLEITDVPVDVGGTGRVLVVPANVNVVLSGGVDELASISAQDLRVSVSADSRGMVQPTITAPPNVHAVCVSPSWVRVISIASP
jgi:hypothetical protein